MILWNLEKVEDLEKIQGLDGSSLRKVFRLAEYRDNRLLYIKPLKVRRGWLNDSWVVDGQKTGRPYGAGDTLSPVPGEVIVLVRER